MRMREIRRRITRSVEAFVDAADYDPLSDIAARVERLERMVADLRKPTDQSA